MSLRRTPTSTGNRLKGTWSFWVKRNTLNGSATSNYIFYADNGGSQANAVRFNDDDGGDSLRALFWNGTSNGGFINFNKLRDPSSWQHYLIVYDSTLNTKDNFSNNDQTLERIKIFVNGRRMIETGGSSAQNTGITANQLMTTWGNPGSINTLFATDTNNNGAFITTFDAFFVDGQALTPDVFGFYKDGNGYISAGSTQTTDFRPGQWVPKKPSVIKNSINNSGGFGVNGFYLPMNESSNFGADFHCDPNSIITLQDETAAQPKNGAPTTTDAYVSQLREDPYAANLVLAVPGITGAPGVAYTDFSANIKGSGTNKVLTANGNAGVAVTASYYGSAMQFDGTNDYFSIPNNSDFYFDGDFTVETWIYRNVTNTSETIVGVFENSSPRRSWMIETRANSALRFEWYPDGSSSRNITSANDSVPGGQWNHIAMVKNNNTITGYINGVAVGIDTIAGSLYENTNDPLRIGILNAAEDQDFNGYIQDLRVYKGVAKYKGGFDVPKPYTPVGIATWRAVPDCTANNFATLNPIFPTITGSNIDYTNGNLTVSNTDSSGGQAAGSIGFSTGKWYFEGYPTTSDSQTNLIGIRPAEYLTTNPQNRTSYRSSGEVYNDNGTSTQSGTTYTTGDVIGVAVDMNDRNIWFSKNGVWVYSGDPDAGTNPAVGSGITFDSYTPATMFDNAAGTKQWDMNFGQNPTFSGQVSAGATERNSDSNGKGEFRYEPPSGFLALCEDNLPSPAIADPGDYFKTVLYTGTGASRNVTGLGFKPDLVWLKSRTGAFSHFIFDSVRGSSNNIFSNLSNAEASATDRVLSFDSDGFSLGGAGGSVNGDDEDIVAWCWKAGAGTTSTNTDGSINSVVSVNQDAGFSIVSYTGNGSNPTTVGHGLTKAPKFILFKCRTHSVNWFVYHGFDSSGAFEGLNTNSAYNSGLTLFNQTAPTSSVINLGSADSNISGRNYIAYCWAEIEGFSKFGSYVGNADADGPFVYCGFKPAWVMVKRTDDTDSWAIFDSSRDSTNPVENLLRAEGTNVEATMTSLVSNPFGDILSNGFKVRNTSTIDNQGTYIFAAFAESPFKTANAK